MLQGIDVTIAEGDARTGEAVGGADRERLLLWLLLSRRFSIITLIIFMTLIITIITMYN